MRSRIFAAVLTVAFGLLSIGPALAAGGQFGNLNGTVTDASTHAPVANAAITAKSGSGTYTAKTDASGKFTILGMNVDSYTVTVVANGYEALNIPNVVVFGDETDSIGVVGLSKQLKEITHVTSRSVSSAYQPTQTIDSYTVNQAQILQATGKANSTNENAVLLSVPGVTLTDTGVPTIRGGAATEVGYQLDGVTFREPFLSMNGGQGLINGLGSVQIVEGAGDATQGGVGSGVINVIPPRGSGPGSGSADFEAGGPAFNHQVAFDYGFSTPNNRISEYISYTGQRFAPYFGYTTTPLNQYGNYFASTYQTTDQFTNNFLINFGKNNHETFQVFYANTLTRGYQPFVQPYYYPYDPITVPAFLGTFGLDPADAANAYANANGNTPPFPIFGMTPAQYAAIVPITNGVPLTAESPTSPQQNFENSTEFLKLEYDNRINATTYFDLRYYNWNFSSATDDSETLGAWGSGIPGSGGGSTTGGPTTGFSTDLEKQFGANITVTLEGQYNLLKPEFNLISPIDSFYYLLGSGLNNPVTLSDFASGGYLCGNTTFQSNVGACAPDGYTSGRIPGWGIGYQGTTFQNWGGGLRFQYQPVDSLKFDLGVREEGQNQHWYDQLQNVGLSAPSVGYLNSCAAPVAQANPTLIGSALNSAIAAAGCSPISIASPFDVLNSSWTNNVLHPSVVQPRASVSWQVDRRDAIRFGYGRSAVFANAQTAGTPFNLATLNKYTTIPAKGGSLCGWTSTYVFGCNTVADQLYWEGDNLEAPDAGNGLPAIYNNYDISWNHLFKNGWGLRVTPFSKLGTDLPDNFYLNPVLGIFAVSNQGYNKTNGVELGLTTPQKKYGLSGYFTATYQNVLSTTPPLSSGETTVPFVPTASLALGDLYRAGYVSPFSINVGAVENLSNGFSISPQLYYNIGYPYSVGNLIAAQLPNGTYANIPQVDFGPGTSGGVASFIGTAPGSSISTNYYDPAYPGSVGSPNIAATRGTPATAANGGKLSHPNLLANLALQLKRGPNTFGIQFYNLFGNAFINTVPAINTYYQPVANGLSGPQTNYNSCVSQVGNGNRGCYEVVPKDLYAFSNGAYLLSNGAFNSGVPGLGPLQPFSFRVFYQRSL